MNWENAIEFLLAGATAVAVGTANFIKPFATMDILNGMELYMEPAVLKTSILLSGD